MYNSYKTLNVQKDATPEQIRKHYQQIIERVAVKKTTPENIQRIIDIRDSYIELIDPAKRAEHDQKLGLYSADETAPWRDHYRNYSNAQMEQDLELADDLIAQAESADRSIFSWETILIIIAGLLVILFIITAQFR